MGSPEPGHVRPPGDGRTVAIVDGHELIIDLLGLALGADHDVVALSPTASGRSLANEVRCRRAGVAVMDLELGGSRDGSELVPPFRQAGARVVILTGVSDPVRQLRALDVGAEQVLPKSTRLPHLRQVVTAALGGRELPTQAQRRELEQRIDARRRGEAGRLAPFEQLTARECSVLSQLMEGHRAQRIATEGCVSIATVRSQIRSILTKLEVGSQLEATAMARAAGWMPPPGPAVQAIAIRQS